MEHWALWLSIGTVIFNAGAFWMQSRQTRDALKEMSEKVSHVEEKLDGVKDQVTEVDKKASILEAKFQSFPIRHSRS